MSEQMEEKIKAYRTAPFDARFPNTNQTRNCFQNYLGKPARPHLHGACQPELGWAYSRRRRANVFTVGSNQGFSCLLQISIDVAKLCQPKARTQPPASGTRESTRACVPSAGWASPSLQMFTLRSQHFWILFFPPRVSCRFRNGTSSSKQERSLEKSEQLWRSVRLWSFCGSAGIKFNLIYYNKKNMKKTLWIYDFLSSFPAGKTIKPVIIILRWMWYTKIYK